MLFRSRGEEGRGSQETGGGVCRTGQGGEAGERKRGMKCSSLCVLTRVLVAKVYALVDNLRGGGGRRERGGPYPIFDSILH